MKGAKVQILNQMGPLTANIGDKVRDIFQRSMCVGSTRWEKSRLAAFVVCLEVSQTQVAPSMDGKDAWLDVCLDVPCPSLVHVVLAGLHHKRKKKMRLTRSTIWASPEGDPNEVSLYKGIYQRSVMCFVSSTVVAGQGSY